GELLSMTNQVRSRSISTRHRKTPPEELYYRHAPAENPHRGWMRTTRRYTIPARSTTRPATTSPADEAPRDDRADEKPSVRRIPRPD
ncbi:MAG: hypothetical protein ACOC8F_03430, partial [Planctomycetota bacterium]